MTLALAPIGILYGAVARARLRLYRAGFLKTHNIGVPVISIGNITTGGTGKTPLVEWVARAVAAEGRRACVLTRGYGRADESRRVVVSDGGRVLAGVRESGDEPLLLAERLAGTASVVCDRDRVSAAHWARENLRAEVFILDDGFQHLKIARDLDIVTLDATAPWGGGHILPRGRLREPREGLARADCIVITRSDMADDLEGLRDEASELSGGHAVVVASRVRSRGLRMLCDDKENREGALIEVESFAAQHPAAAFCAIGNPRAFFEQLRREGFDLRHTRAFPDHHNFQESDIAAVAREAISRGAHILLTTAKDAVKLRGRSCPLPIYIVEIGLEFEDEGVLLELVREAIER